MTTTTHALAHVLGPKAEQGKLLEDTLLLVVRDYLHWRLNYFPGDRMLLDAARRQEFAAEHDRLVQAVHEMMADLRRSFPFYSPRYFAHMLSEISIPALIGYVATLLYNPNNVTPEAAPVTVDWEIDACGRLLAMLGYTPPPVPHKGEARAYLKALGGEFGWCHLTSGGTVANIEALWIARSVKYLPLAVWQVARAENLPIPVKLPGGRRVDIRLLDAREVAWLSPTEAIALLSRFVEVLTDRHRACRGDLGRAGETAWDLLRQSDYSPSGSLARAFTDFPPVVFVSGAGHYSIQKAADILGLGRDNVELVEVDRHFCLDVEDLERRLARAVRDGRTPVAVVAVAGTTEEGAVDPIHRIVDLRARMQSADNRSFWLHVDAAWGGFIRSLFAMTPADEAHLPMFALGKRLGLAYAWDLAAWHAAFVAPAPAADVRRAPAPAGAKDLLEASGSDPARYARMLRALLGDRPENDHAHNASLQDRVEAVNAYVREDMRIAWNSGRRTFTKTLRIQWGSKEVCSAFLAFPKADSITIDPHKLGYLPYPCGAVAFRNDRVRHVILQRAPYITSFRTGAPLVHQPPRRLDRPGAFDERIVTEAFACFILEGSRPGAAAGALHLAANVLPWTMRQHGSLIRASLLGARAFHEWLTHWDKVAMATGVETSYRLVTLSDLPPQTNLVVFAIAPRRQPALQAMNEATALVRNRFTIQVELGDRQYSYTQPFFLSSTTMSAPRYSFAAMRPFLERAGVETTEAEYRKTGVVMLRATLMNPYLLAILLDDAQPLLQEFMRELHAAAEQAVARVCGKRQEAKAG
jgi:glutamate/tyrosine decarboxylase-like PLP-dependent enzyme